MFDYIVHVQADDSAGWPSGSGSTPNSRRQQQKQSGAARQIFGSNALRPHGIHLVSTAKPFPISPYLDLVDGEYIRIHRPTYPHGIVHTVPVESDLDARPRNIGGVRVPSNMGPGQSDDLYGARPGGERRGDGYDRYGHQPGRYGGHSNGHANEFVPHAVMEPEEEMLDAHDSPDGAGNSESDCTISCLDTEFLCLKSCVCILKHLRCDEELDCEDGEDELECDGNTNEEIINNIKKDCESTGLHAMCPQTFICISKDWLCDGDDDCGDFFDETHCGERLNCSSDQFECQNGLCIQKSWVCDGENDCRDYSDEMNCTKVS